jgi:RHS repeat-associated protein
MGMSGLNDAGCQLSRVRRANGRPNFVWPATRTKYTYDADDDRTSVTDPRGLETSYGYDGFGDIAQVMSPDSGTTQFSYDSGGDAATSIDGRNVKATHSYDVLDRVTQIVYPDQTVSFTYDQGSNGIGHLSSVTDGTGETAFNYDPLGRVTKRTETVDGTSLSVSYAYQNRDLSSLTTPSGQSLVYGYNANGQVSSITLNGTVLMNAIQYSPFGPVSGWTWGNGTQTVRDYDLDGNITEIDNPGQSSTYTYNDDQTVNSRTDSTEGDYSVVAGTTNVAVSTTSNQVSGTSGALVRTYSYDGAGNTTGNGGASFAYNGAGRLSSVTEAGATVNFGVNALGQRVSKTSSDGTVLFAYDEQGHLIGEYGPTGSLLEETVWLGDIPVATLRPDSSGGVDIYYVDTDRLDTPRAITRAADNTVVWRWSSDPYGNGFVDEDPEGSGQLFVYNLRFPGQYYDSETGLVYNDRRDYDPQLGRYVESDPIGLKGGSLSTYAYVNDQPLKRVDPSGEGFVDCIKAVAELVKATAALSGRMDDMDAHAGIEDPMNHPKAIEQAVNRVRKALDKVERSCGCAVGAAAAIAAAKAALERAGPYLLEAVEVGAAL